MNLRLLLILTLAVLGIGAAAYYFGEERKALQSEAFEPGPFLAGLEARVNDVDEARIQSQEGGTVTLQRRDGVWGVAEHYGYRANVERVAGLLKLLASLETIEPKTQKAENHKRLNLDDPAGEFSLATRITLLAGDATVADVVAGLNRDQGLGGGAFMRKWGDDQTWLVKGEVKPKRRVLDYLDRSVVNVDGRRMRLARIRHLGKPDGGETAVTEMLMVTAEKPDQQNYSLGASIPEGAKPKPNHELSAVIRLLDFLIFEDVRPASEVTSEPVGVAVYETFDGLKVTIAAHPVEGADGKVEHWAKVAVEAGERSADLDAFIEANKGQDTEAGRIAEQMKTPEEVAKEIERRGADVVGWAYKLTDYKTKRLLAKTEDLIELPKPEAKPGEGEAAAPK